MKKEKKSKKPDLKKNTKKKSPKKKDTVILESKPSKTTAAPAPKKDALKDQVEELVAKYQALDSAPRFYGGSIPLYISEINTLRVVGDTPSLNLTKIAAALDVSKSAISKSSGKLLEKGLITKERSVREVLFNLTDLGQEVYTHINQEDDRAFSDVKALLDTLTKNDRQVINNFLSGLNKALDQSLNHLKASAAAIDEIE